MTFPSGILGQVWYLVVSIPDLCHLSTLKNKLVLLHNMAKNIMGLSYDVASESEITPCNKICKPLVVYRFSGKRYGVHNNVAYITCNDKIITFLRQK